MIMSGFAFHYVALSSCCFSKKNVMTLFCYGFQGEKQLVAILRCSGFLVELRSYFVTGYRQGYESSLLGWGQTLVFGLLTDTIHGSDTLCYDEQTVTWFFLFHFWTPPECMFVFSVHAPVPVFP